MTVHGLTVPTPDAGWPTVAGLHLRLWDCGVTWKDVNPSRGVFDWTRLDRLVAESRAAGMVNVTLVLGATPRWAARDPDSLLAAPWLGPGTNSPPHTMSDWTGYVASVAARYRGLIGSYEIWNEPTLRDFWLPTSYALLAEMTRLAKMEIRAMDPGAKVVAGAVLPRPSSGGMKRSGKYLSALKGKGWPVDVWNAHLYPETGEGPARWRQMVQEWTGTLHALNAPRKPRWVTETNFDLLAFDTNPMGKVEIEAYMQRVDVIAEAEHVHKVYWYCWQHGDPKLLGIPFTASSVGTGVLARLVKENSGG